MRAKGVKMKAFKCDYCREYYEGEPNVVDGRLKNDSRGLLDACYDAFELCDTCYEPLRVWMREWWRGAPWREPPSANPSKTGSERPNGGTAGVERPWREKSELGDIQWPEKIRWSGGEGEER